ncbi:MAG: hypothetical protein V4773_10505 [Verrucomicrobiota bacterium]
MAIAAAGGTTASAQIVYSGVQNVSTTGLGGPVVGFDVNGGGNDFNFQIANSGGPIKPVVSTANSAVGLATAGSFVVVNFGGGQEIGPAVPEWSAGTFNWFNQATDGSQFFGFSFVDGTSPTLYGWARMNFDSVTTTATVVDWAYNSNGGSITTGAIPEPATNAAIGGAAALLAGSVAAWRRRQKQRTAVAA